MRRPSFSFYVLLAAALFVFIHTFRLLSPILLSFILILLVSMAVNPVVIRLRTLTGGRRLATGVVVGAFILVLALTGWALAVPVSRSVSSLAERLPQYWERMQKPLARLEKQAVVSEAKIQEEVTNEMAQEAREAGEHKRAEQVLQTPNNLQQPENTGSLRSGIANMLQGVAGSFTSLAFNAAEIAVVLVTVFFGVVFTLMNPRPIFASIFALVPERFHPQALTIAQRIGTFVPSWALATLLGMVVIGTLVFLCMWPIFGFTDALILGLIAGVLEAVPYLGPLLSAVPALLFALGKGGMTPLWVVLAYSAVQALENNLILPLIMARSMKLHPLAVIFSMLLCVAIFGVLGVLIAAPMVAVVQILHDELYRKRFLPDVSDADLDRLANRALSEKHHSK